MLPQPPKTEIIKFDIKNSTMPSRCLKVSANQIPGQNGPIVDVNALRTNQVLIVASVVIAFVLGATAGAWVLLAVAIGLLVGAARPGYGPFQIFYREVLRPTGLVKPNPRPDDPAPHRFAQAMGGTVLLLAASALFAGAELLGWVLAFVVLTFALVNLLFGFCAGCFIFLQINRIRQRAGGSA
jgi:Domain of unknown function (DUF4395)